MAMGLARPAFKSNGFPSVSTSLPLLQAVANGITAPAMARGSFTLDDLVHKALENEKKNGITAEAETAPAVARASTNPVPQNIQVAQPATGYWTEAANHQETSDDLESNDVAASRALLSLARVSANAQAQARQTLKAPAGVVPASNGAPANSGPTTTLVPPSIPQQQAQPKSSDFGTQEAMAAQLLAAQRRMQTAQQQQQASLKPIVIPAGAPAGLEAQTAPTATALLEQAMGTPAQGLKQNMEMLYRNSHPMQQAMYAHAMNQQPLLMAALQNQQRIMNMNISHIQLKKMITERADPDNFCPCGRLLLQAYIADPCGHEFCENCMSAHQTTGKDFPRCGACEQTLYPKLTLVPALTRRKTVSQIKCRCLYEHCPETLTLGNLSNHLKHNCSVHAQVLQSYTLRANANGRTS